ncbi:Bro-N domain-containing protein [Rodentibacter caecimuris]|uniref:BRO-N domain-containing protein n=1 Tax=Rodentibacter caecimuris TaxID=1796644 RepID=UPI00259105A1|nr:BRO family protein [Rodentibacter heylii]
MKTVLSTFNFHSFPVRINVLNQEPFFCLLDVATVLGLGNRSVSKFKFNPKGVEKLSTPSNGGDQEMIFINEPNLYRVIFRSNKPEAETFQNWVFEEVLPQIRKTGKYEHKTTVDERTGLRNAVNMLVSKKGLIYSEAYNLVHQYMNVESIEDIPADKLQSAVEYVHKIALEGEWITEEPKSHTVEIPHAGRWLVIVDKYDPRRNRIKDMSGCNFVDTKLARQLLGETHQMADLLLELSKRMRLIDGYYEDNFNTPLMETKARTII